MSSSWSLVRIDKILKLQRRWIQLEPLKQYQEIGLRSFGKGIFHKTPVYGADLGNKRVLEIHPGDLVFSNVFAWEGAVGVATKAERGMIGSHRFVTYTPIENSCSVEYLQLFFHSPEGLEIIRKVSPGSAGRNRTLNLKQFDKAMIPLPPIAEQRRIVARIEELAAKIEEARRLREGAIQQLNSLVGALNTKLFSEIKETDIHLIEEFCDVRGGIQKSGKRTPGKNPRRYLTVAHVQRNWIDTSDPRYFEVSDTELERWRLQSGDVLVIEGNGSADHIGRTALFNGEIEDCVHQNHIIRIRPNTNKAVPAYVNFYLNSPLGKQQMMERSRTTSGLFNLSVGRIKSLEIPILSIPEQNRIVDYAENLQSKIKGVAKQREDALKEFDALLPATLDKAFKGEL